MATATATALALLALACSTGAARAESYPRTLGTLTTGNGHGFQWYDVAQHKLVGFLEHPYRYLRASPSDPHGPGEDRRNLAYDAYFGLRTAMGAGWLSTADDLADPEYLDESNIIHLRSSLAGVTAEQYLFAPFGYEGNALIALLSAPGASDGLALLNFHLGSKSGTQAGTNGERVAPLSSGALYETGPGGGVMVYVPLDGVSHTDCAGVFGKIASGLGDNTSCAGDDVVPAFQKALGPDGWMAVAIGYRDAQAGHEAEVAAALASELTAWANHRTAAQLLADARAEWNAWRKPPPVPLCTDGERALWRQSEAVLRMAQVREPNTADRKSHGMLLASLPPGEWHTGWVRDGVYGLVALAQSGHLAEARAALDFFLGAGPVGGYASYVGNQPYRISLTRYFGSGEEECDWNDQGPNIELDGWGLVLWAARQYVSASGDVGWLDASGPSGANFGVLEGLVAQPLEANLEPSGIVKAESSIWESHQPGKHYAYSTLAAARGFCDLGALAAAVGDGAKQARWAMQSQATRSGLYAQLLDENGAIAGSLEGLGAGRYFDAAVIESFNWGLLAADEQPTAGATLHVLDYLRIPTGGYKRNNDGLSSYDSNEWVFIDLRVSEALRRVGRSDEADALIQLVTDKAGANFHLLPELYTAVGAEDALGGYAGAIPMSGFGAGAYLLALLDRGGARAPDDCGDGAGAPSGPAWQCPGASAGDGGAGDASDGGTGDGGADNASDGDAGDGDASDGGAGDSDAGDGGMPPTPPAESGCGCALGARRGPTPSPDPLALGLALALLVAVERRRRRAQAASGVKLRGR